MTMRPASDSDFAVLVEQALGNLRSEPRRLLPILEMVAEINNFVVSDGLERLIHQLAHCGPNDRLRHVFIQRLQQWDHEPAPSWSHSTKPHSEARRRDALRLLGFGADTFPVLNEAIPRFTESEIPIVIAEKHAPWYEVRKHVVRPFYWAHYRDQLAQPKGSWDTEAISALNVSTDDVLSRLSDPTSSNIYQVKGLVMGYVQSGKTSHFSGLIAKAADSGYRLIVVLAGTLDILREQTQRRIDKEIVGRELLEAEEYGGDADWESFVSHGARPSEQGIVDIERLTDRHSDYDALRQHLAALQFKRLDPTKPYNDASNLSSAPVKLAVIKKTPNRIAKLCTDLRRLKELRSQLEHVPTLVIDDESDQASVNTIDRSKSQKKSDRTSTNKAIAELLGLLPRAQYVGYTATPFANVFIDPEDADDLFPKDFLVSLPRPPGYMGVSDFYDLEDRYGSDDYRNNKKAYVRPVEGPNGNEENLPEAIDAFVLAGAIKLFRQSKGGGKNRFRHHTMLVHHSSRKTVHKDEAEEVGSIFAGGARYHRAEGIERLQGLLEGDFRPVSLARAPQDLFPASFQELRPFIGECVSRICADKAVLIVNGDNRDDTPNFEQSSIWAILVGGAKLSRGYTVEGLTTSYYRRPAGAGDTLMQMGRWFGFRPGYRDLVRLYIGKSERRGSRYIDLYEAFGAVCRDEEALRADLLKYRQGGLTPKQVAPLVRQHLPFLPPTSRNKMFNAQIRSMDFGGAWMEKTSAPIRPNDMRTNLRSAATLLSKSRNLGKMDLALTNAKGVARAFNAFVAATTGEAVLEFLLAYKWSDSASAVKLETDYLSTQLSSGRLKRWTLILPQAQGASRTLEGSGFPGLAVVGRSRVSETRFGVFSEPRHRDVAEYVSAVSDGVSVSNNLQNLRDPEAPVLVLYLVTDLRSPKSGLSIGFGIQFPGAKTTNAIVWSVADPKNSDKVVVASKLTKVK